MKILGIHGNATRYNNIIEKNHEQYYLYYRI